MLYDRGPTEGAEMIGAAGAAAGGSDREYPGLDGIGMAAL